MPLVMKRKLGVYKAPGKKKARLANAKQAVVVSKRVPRGIQPMVDIGSGFPRMMKTKIHYVDNLYAKTAAAGAQMTYNYVLNGLYDFDASGTGHQPFYFDQLIAIYSHYTVIGAKVDVTWTNNSTVPCVVGGFVNDDTTISVSGLSTFQEQATSQYRTLPSSTSEQPPVTLTHKWSAKDHFTNNSKSILSNTDLAGTAGANPVEQSALTLYAQSLDTAATSTSVNFTIRGEFIVVFWELREQSQS